MAKVFTKPAGLVVQVGNYGPASNEAPATVPSAVAAELAGDERLRVEDDGAEVAPPPRVDDLDVTPGGLATVNSTAAEALIAKADTAAELDRLERAECASERHPGGRKRVLVAIAERRVALGLTEPDKRGRRPQED